jgi:hypothetical protein
MISVRAARGGMRRTASSTFPFSFLQWNNDRDGKVFQRNVSLNHSREDNLRHAEFAQKWQAFRLCSFHCNRG